MANRLTHQKVLSTANLLLEAVKELENTGEVRSDPSTSRSAPLVQSPDLRLLLLLDQNPDLSLLLLLPCLSLLLHAGMSLPVLGYILSCPRCFRGHLNLRRKGRGP